MKKIICLSVTFICVLTLYAQTPGINYQAVVRDADGTPISNQAISLTIDILESEQVLLREKHELSTDEFGLINTMIGSGTAELGSIEDLIGKKDLAYEISADLNGTEMMIGSGKMGAVPFAFYGADEDADPENELQELSLRDAKLSLTGSEGEVDLSKFRSPWIADSLGYTLYLDSDSISQNRESGNSHVFRLGLNGGLFSYSGDNQSPFMGLGSQGASTLCFVDSETGTIADESRIRWSNFVRSLRAIEGNGDATLSLKLDNNVNSIEHLREIDGSMNRVGETRILRLGKEPLELSLDLSKSEVLTNLNGFIWGRFANIQSQTPFGVRTLTFRDGNSEVVNPTYLALQSNHTISYDVEPVNSSDIQKYHQVEIFPGTWIDERLISIDTILRNESKLTPDGEVVCSIETTLTTGGDINTVKSAMDLTTCNEIPSGGSFSNKVSQNGGTAINDGIDGNTRFREILSRDSSASSGDIVFEDEVGALAAISAVASGGAAILNSAGGGSAPPELSSRNMAAFPNTQHITEGGLELSLGVNSDFAGNISVLNDGVQNMNIGTLQGIPNAGAIVGYNEGAPKWYLYTQDGVSKLIVDMIQSTFLSPNTDEEIAYGTLAGPEQAVYERGTATLVNGEVFVSCADHFAGVADPGSMTVTVTPLSAESLGLAIVEKSGAGFKVKELYQGKGNYSFDYMVMCKRSDVTYQLKPDLPEADESMKKISDSVRIEYEKAKKSRK